MNLLHRETDGLQRVFETGLRHMVLQGHACVDSKGVPWIRAISADGEVRKDFIGGCLPIGTDWTEVAMHVAPCYSVMGSQCVFDLLLRAGYDLLRDLRTAHALDIFNAHLHDSLASLSGAQFFSALASKAYVVADCLGLSLPLDVQAAIGTPCVKPFREDHAIRLYIHQDYMRFKLSGLYIAAKKPDRKG